MLRSGIRRVRVETARLEPCFDLGFSHAIALLLFHVIGAEMILKFVESYLTQENLCKLATEANYHQSNLVLSHHEIMFR